MDPSAGNIAIAEESDDGGIQIGFGGSFIGPVAEGMIRSYNSPVGMGFYADNELVLCSLQ